MFGPTEVKNLQFSTSHNLPLRTAPRPPVLQPGTRGVNLLSTVYGSCRFPPGRFGSENFFRPNGIPKLSRVRYSRIYSTGGTRIYPQMVTPQPI
jgi:hypothetical protein